ncbi:MAG TPA: prepilin-type N-terminal cleavage/methylation domain-containing protein [Patescibacteria group bacterium]|nr:prepilin-type N-terminal cleavage/methylation domain-containing protein [Patescibacteria group bacterium]
MDVFRLSAQRVFDHQRQARPAAAFTLVELLIAVMVVSIAFLAILQLFSAILFSTEVNRNTSIAMTHLLYVLEDIKSTKFVDISTKINAGNWNMNSTQITAAGLQSLTNETIQAQVSGAGTSLLTVTATANWFDNRNRARTISLKTFFSQP